MRSLLTILAAFALSVGLTWAAIPLLRRLGAVALPNERTMHSGVVPKGGGWPVLAAVLMATALFWPPDRNVAILFACLAVLAAVSWRNDLEHVAAPVRLAIHLLASAISVLSVPKETLILQGLLPFALDRAVAGLALAWFMNVYNFMDGIDGIAGLETAAIALGYILVTWAAGGSAPLEGLALAIAGAAAGFLVWNRPPARIFLGDAGSIPLGFLTGWLLIDLAARHSLTAAIILPLYFLADASITLGRRILRGEAPAEPHRSHFYQRAAGALNSHGAIAVRVAICNAVLIGAALLALRSPLAGLLLAGAAVTVLLADLERISGRNAAKA